MRTIVALVVHIPIVAFLGAAIVMIAATPGDMVLIGSRPGPQIPVPRLYGQAGFLAVLVPLAVLALTRMARAAGELWRARGKGRAPEAGLGVDEIVLWRGGPGWRSFNGWRILLTLLGALGPTIYVFWLWRIWVGNDLLWSKLFDTFVATFVLAGQIIAVLVTGLPKLRVWICDVFGIVVVTDRRIAWLTPWRGDVYRELHGAELIFAGLIEGDDKRGWVTVSESRRGHVKEIDLKGLPQPRLAVAAIETLMARSAGDVGLSTGGLSNSA